MRAVATTLFVLVGLVNAFPILGAISGARLEAFYGIAIDDPNLAILMRHRAVLLGIVGGLLLAAAWHRPLRLAGAAAGFVSMLSYLALVLWVGEHNALVGRVAWIDVVAVVALAIAVGLDRTAPPTQAPA